MNIIFDNGRTENEVRRNGQDVRSNVDKVTTTHGNSSAKSTGSRGVFALDISGTVMDNTAYEGQGKTAEDVMQNAGQIDVATQKNYMAVMSNTMSDEDFAKLQKEGYHPGDTEIETVVTIVDEIKAALAKGGTHIKGYTDDLDVETLTQITGSAGLAQEIAKQFSEYDIPVTKENVEDVLKVCSTVTQLDSLSDGVKKYMVRNHMAPTIDNIYRAQYSASADADKQGRGYYQDEAGYYAKKAEEYNWQQLQPQMEKVIEGAGLTVSDETLADARWLIEKGMPLTEDSLNALYELRNLEVPETMEETVALAAGAIADGKQAGAANIADDRTSLEKALEYIEDMESITDEAVDKVAAEGKLLNIRNLKAAQIQISMSVKVESYAVSFGGRRLMEEVRLQMTVEANIHLIRSGFSIDTAELEQLVESLKAAEQQAQEQMFGKEALKTWDGQPLDAFKNTLSTVRELYGMPAALVGRFAYTGQAALQVTASAFTLEAAYAEGAVLRSAYEKAGESYETLMTAPRADMGDSIKKAFRNIDDILKDMQLEISEANRRAVRILGYNRMEISEENISAVKMTDLSLKRVLEKLTPASTLQMIRDGVNPLTMNMEELESYLNGQEKDPQQEVEKYSEYLYKLDKNHAISETEREAYIGIYRLFRQLEKTDGAAIGTLIHQGVEPTVRNLLSAMRSNKKHGMDVTVSDSFGGVSSSYSGKSISEQIESGYYGKLAADIYDNLDGSRMDAVPAAGDFSLEEMAWMLRNQDAEEDAQFGQGQQNQDREYVKQQAGEFRAAVTAEETVIKELLDFKQPITANNLLAAGLLMKERGKAAGRLHELASESDRAEQLEEAVQNLHENMTDAEAAGEAYEKLNQTYTDILEEIVYSEEDVRRIDLKEIGNLHKQISLSGNLSKEENYEIPVRIGEEVTSINLKIIHDSKDTGKVTAALETAVYGKTAAQFSISMGSSGEYELSGYIACESQVSLELLQKNGEGLKKALEQSDIKIVSLRFIYNSGLDLAAATAVKSVAGEAVNTGSRQEVSMKKLYDTAKAFIGYIQKGEGIL